MRVAENGGQFRGSVGGGHEKTSKAGYIRGEMENPLSPRTHGKVRLHGGLVRDRPCERESPRTVHPRPDSIFAARKAQIVSGRKKKERGNKQKKEAEELGSSSSSSSSADLARAEIGPNRRRPVGKARAKFGPMACTSFSFRRLAGVDVFTRAVFIVPEPQEQRKYRDSGQNVASGRLRPRRCSLC